MEVLKVKQKSVNQSMPSPLKELFFFNVDIPELRLVPSIDVDMRMNLRTYPVSGCTEMQSSTWITVQKTGDECLRLRRMPQP